MGASGKRILGIVVLLVLPGVGRADDSSNRKRGEAFVDQLAAGFVAMAAPARPLADLIAEQLAYVAGLDGEIDAVERADLDEIAQQAALACSPELDADVPPEQLPMGVPARYWLDLRGYEPHRAAQGIERPLLVLQGERDYQVTMEDFGAWSEALAGRKDVVLVSYPGLNHLFMMGEGPCTPAEYEQPGHVAVEVIEAIAGFVLGLS